LLCLPVRVRTQTGCFTPRNNKDRFSEIIEIRKYL